MTPKAIGKAIKAKGLQKLKFYCQMCQKQCRDANGFKCHTTSEAHQRQLLLFAENPHKYMDEFSSDFLKDFLHLLKTRFGTRRVAANQVYQEYIKDRNHLHMNSTRWVTLTGFCKWMGRKGICTVDETERGWFITYIDRDPETLKKQENKNKEKKAEKDYEERMAKIIEEQIERGKKAEERRKQSQRSHQPGTSQDEDSTHSGPQVNNEDSSNSDSRANNEGLDSAAEADLDSCEEATEDKRYEEESSKPKEERTHKKEEPSGALKRPSEDAKITFTMQVKKPKVAPVPTALPIFSKPKVKNPLKNPLKSKSKK